MPSASSRIPTRRWEPQTEGHFVLAAFTAWGHVADYQLAGRQRIGRLGASPDVDVQLPSQVLSAEHGELLTEGATCFYRDLMSTNGTLLNGKQVEGAVTLTEGDALGFAPHGDPASIALKLVVLQLVNEEPTWQRVALESVQEVVVGRRAGIAISDEYVSKTHATFFPSSQGLMLIDLGSTNGVFLNGERIQGSARISVLDVVRIGSTVIVCFPDDLWICHDVAVEAPDGGMGLPIDGIEAEPASTCTPKPEVAPVPIPTPPHVEAPAAMPEPACRPAVEAPASIAPPVAAVAPEQTPTPSAVAPRTFPGDPLVIDIVEKNVWDRIRKKTLLRDFHLSVEPGDFVLILGGSGAGKSTFVNAVMGNDRAEGTIRYGDLDVYEEYDRIRYQIGYVPQQDLLRLNDSVESTLLAAAQMRMPRRSKHYEYHERAEWAASLLGLSREGETIVGHLSGGQRKRLSIAVELVGNPSLFFLDEPDSGLDGIIARTLMENLRAIADLGKMVLVITHGPDRAQDLFTKVLVLAKSERDGAGHMAFYGSVEEAKAHFGTTGLEAIVRKINRTDEGGEGLADHFIDLWEGRAS